MHTIYAVSSGQPPAAIAVLRISGAAAFESVRCLARSLPEPRRAGVRALLDPLDGSLLDRALVLLFPGPNSATGEDLAELHLHGGRAVVKAVERALASMALRAAEPGEFTRRALLNGRIDLTEAEGLGDLLTAETEGQRRAAVQAAEGVLRRQIKTWTERLLLMSAQVEARLDHSDEDHVAAAGDPLPALKSQARELAHEISAVVAQPPSERLRDGIRVVLAGPPNSGKSTLLNALVQREAAIVSPISGTTRDRIEVPVARDGIAYVFTDTAGLTGQTDDPIERIGIERAHEAMASADIIVWLGDGRPPAGALALHPRKDAKGRAAAPEGRLSVSAETGEGIPDLWRELALRSQALLPAPDAMALNERQRDLASEAADALMLVGSQSDLLIIAELMRHARLAFDRITGAADVEAVLDALFSSFCIGK